MPITRRSNFIDSMRGSAIALMIIYHFCYDLTHFGLYYFDFYNSVFWPGLRTFIVTMFLSLVGISLYLAHNKGIRWKQASKRLLILLICSLLISLASYLLFPGRTIFFGILHFITVASLLAIFFIKCPAYSLVVGSILIIIGNSVTDTVFNQPWLHWIGLMTHRPFTEDYVPLLPWLGVVLCGITVGHLLCHTNPGKQLLNTNKGIARSATLNWAGRHSLWIYMLHQPLLFGTLWAVTSLLN